MTKKLRYDRPHPKNHAQTVVEKPEYPEKTDSSKEYQVNRIETLFLYCLGKSPYPLTMSKIEDEVGREMEGVAVKNSRKDKPKFRRNYVYKIEKKLFHESEFIPSRLIFTSDDFLKYEMEDYRIELSESSGEKLTKFFRGLFSLKSEIPKPSFEIIEYCKIVSHDIIKAIKISDNDSNFLSIEVNYSNLVESLKRKSGKDKLRGLQKNDLKMFIGSPSFKSDIELNVHTQREKGRWVIREFDIFSKIHLKNYIDNISNNSRKEYVLNLRGLLKYLSNHNSKTNSYEKINKVIENLSQVDEYWNVENEFFGFYNNITNLTDETESFKVKQELYIHNIKKGFPFLSFYNQYKDHLPKNYAAKILIKVAKNLKSNLELVDITELKYQVTEFFFSKIQGYFWEFFGLPESEINDKKLSPETVSDILKNYQKEIRYYLGKRKEIESRIYFKQSEYYEEYNFKNETEQKILKYLSESNKTVVCIKEILHPTDPDSMPIGLTGNEISVIQEICESSRLDYVTNKGFFLFKQTEIQKINGQLESRMTLEMVKKIMQAHGISNETAIKDVLVISGYKTTRDKDTKQKIIIKKN